MRRWKSTIKICLLILAIIYFVCNVEHFSILASTNTLPQITPLTNPPMTQRMRPARKIQMAITKQRTHTTIPVRKPVSDVLFLKTHKTGGTTLQNILFRRANKKNLIVGLPKNNGNMFVNFYGRKFNKELMLRPPPSHKHVNMIIGHMIFNQKEISEVMSHNTKYISLLRESGRQFESAFNYLYDRVPAFKLAEGPHLLRNYLENAERYGGGSYVPEGIWWQGKNGVFYEFGYNNLIETDGYIENAIKEIDEYFDFVLILEYFDMSLLLLMDMFDWEMEDILYMEMNARDKTTVEKLDSNLKNLIYDWNKADAALYKHFNASFWRRVEKYGRKRMTQNLSRFQAMKQSYTKLCVEEITYYNKTLNFSDKKNRAVSRYTLRDSEQENPICVEMTTEETEWYRKMRDTQYTGNEKPYKKQKPK